MNFRLAILGAVAFAAFCSLPAFAHPAHDMDPSMPMSHDDMCGAPMGEGVINAVDVQKSKVNITHKAISAIGLDAMTMDFIADSQVDLSAFALGEHVHFLLKEQKDKSYRIAAMCSLDADPGTHEACMAQMHQTAIKIAAEMGKPSMMDGHQHD